MKSEKIDQMLSWISSKTGVDAGYFIRGGFWLGIAQFFTMLKALIMSVLFANLFSKEAFGQYSFVMNILGVAMIFALPGMEYAIVQAVARGYHDTYNKALRVVFKWSIIGSLFLLSVAIYGRMTGNEQGSVLFLILASLFPLYAVSYHYKSFFQGIKRFDVFALLSVCFDIVFVVFVGGIVFFKKDVFWAVIATLGVQILIQGYYSLFLVKRFIKYKAHDNTNISFGKKISFSQAFNALSLRLDGLIVAYFLGFRELAIFTMVIYIPDYIKSLGSNFTKLFLPKLSDQKSIDRKGLNRHFWKLMGIVVLVGGIYIISARFIFRFLYPEYYEFSWLSMVYQIGILAFPATLFTNYFFKEKMAKYVVKTDIITSLILVGSSLLLVNLFDVIGAVSARLIYCFSCLFLVIYYYQKSKSYNSPTID